MESAHTQYSILPRATKFQTKSIGHFPVESAHRQYSILPRATKFQTKGHIYLSVGHFLAKSAHTQYSKRTYAI